MSCQIIRQPDGKFAVFSSIVNHFVTTDATREEITEKLAKQAADDRRAEVDQIFCKLAAGEKPYHQFTMTWDEACQMADMTEQLEAQAAQEEPD